MLKADKAALAGENKRPSASDACHNNPHSPPRSGRGRPSAAEGGGRGCAAEGAGSARSGGSRHPRLPCRSRRPGPSGGSRHPRLPCRSRRPGPSGGSRHPRLPCRSRRPGPSGGSRHPRLPCRSRRPGPSGGSRHSGPFGSSAPPLGRSAHAPSSRRHSSTSTSTPPGPRRKKRRAPPVHSGHSAPLRSAQEAPPAAPFSSKARAPSKSPAAAHPAPHPIEARAAHGHIPFRPSVRPYCAANDPKAQARHNTNISVTSDVARGRQQKTHPLLGFDRSADPPPPRANFPHTGRLLPPLAPREASRAQQGRRPRRVSSVPQGRRPPRAPPLAQNAARSPCPACAPAPHPLGRPLCIPGENRPTAVTPGS